jgi:hydrogenase/urease accessory protein HupE
MAKPWTAWPVAVLVAAAFGVLLWLWRYRSLVKVPAGHRDGLELIGPVLGTLYLVGFVLPTLALGLSGRWLAMAAILALVVVALASDTLWP